jgi:hypothetical protein
LTKTTWLSSPTHLTFFCFLDWRSNWKADKMLHNWGDGSRIAGVPEHTEQDLQDEKKW